MITTELILTVSTTISALIIKCVKEEIGELHVHSIERVESLEKQLGLQQKLESDLKIRTVYVNYTNVIIVMSDNMRKSG